MTLILLILQPRGSVSFFSFFFYFFLFFFFTRLFNTPMAFNYLSVFFEVLELAVSEVIQERYLSYHGQKAFIPKRVNGKGNV